VGENVPPALDEKATVPVGTVGGAEPESVTVTPHAVLVSGLIELGLQVNETETELGVVTVEVVEAVDVEVVVLVWVDTAVVVDVFDCIDVEVEVLV
jgi:hypothetical protein